MVLFLAAGVAYKITRAPHVYAQSATVVFYLPKYRNMPNGYLEFAPSLIMTGNAMTMILMSPQAQRQIRAAGGTANVNFALVNLYDEEYPNYGMPLATLTTTSPSPAADRNTFVVAVAGCTACRRPAGKSARPAAQPHFCPDRWGHRASPPGRLIQARHGRARGAGPGDFVRPMGFHRPADRS